MVRFLMLIHQIRSGILIEYRILIVYPAPRRGHCCAHGIFIFLDYIWVLATFKIFRNQ